MTSDIGNILLPSLRDQLLAVKKAARQIDGVQLKLATGKDVNRAIDDPVSFFASKSLTDRVQDLTRLLDGIGLSIRTIEEAQSGLEGVRAIIDQIDSLAAETRALYGGDTGLENIILADEPVLYYKLNETSGTTATNLGTGGTGLDGTYQGGVTLAHGSGYPAGERTALFDASASGVVAVPDSLLINSDLNGYPARTVELVFHASDVSGRQVLYEEGGGTNGINVYIDDGQLYVDAYNGVDFGPFAINTEIEAEKSYHVALALDANKSEFIAYVNGQEIGSGAVTVPLSVHTGDIAIGGVLDNTVFFDGAYTGGDGFYFDGLISDVAIYNDVLTAEDIQTRYNATNIEFQKLYDDDIATLIAQIDQLVEDTSYLGINLLDKDVLETAFNADRSNILSTEGVNVDSAGLGLLAPDLIGISQVEDLEEDVRVARDSLRQAGFTLTNDLSIIKVRRDFTQETINTLQAGSDDLVVADQNQLGAELLALQTRQAIQFSVISLTAEFQQSTLRLF